MRIKAGLLALVILWLSAGFAMASEGSSGGVLRDIGALIGVGLVSAIIAFFTKKGRQDETIPQLASHLHKNFISYDTVESLVRRLLARTGASPGFKSWVAGLSANLAVRAPALATGEPMRHAYDIIADEFSRRGYGFAVRMFPDFDDLKLLKEAFVRKQVAEIVVREDPAVKSIVDKTLHAELV